MKICSTCGVEKSLVEFYKRKDSKDGYLNKCKSCHKEYKRNYYQENKEVINKKCREYNKGYYEKNKEEINRRSRQEYKNEEVYNKKKQYRRDNKESIREYNLFYYQENKDSLNKKSNEYNKKYYQENKEEILEYKKQYRRIRRNNDPTFKLSCNIRCSVLHSLNNNGYTKSSRTFEILGCSYEDLLKHLNTNPYGFIYGEEGLDVDHIVPISSASTEEEVIKLNHYTNFQLLPSEYNRYIKRELPWDEEHFNQWMKIKLNEK